MVGLVYVGEVGVWYGWFTWERRGGGMAGLPGRGGAVVWLVYLGAEGWWYGWSTCSGELRFPGCHITDP